jgi:hypothetical protein
MYADCRYGTPSQAPPRLPVAASLRPRHDRRLPPPPRHHTLRHDIFRRHYIFSHRFHCAIISTPRHCRLLAISLIVVEIREAMMDFFIAY